MIVCSIAEQRYCSCSSIIQRRSGSFVLIIQLRILFVVIRFNERYLHQVLVLKRAAACFADVVIF